jgi:hypothetical protein
VMASINAAMDSSKRVFWSQKIYRDLIWLTVNYRGRRLLAACTHLRE